MACSLLNDLALAEVSYLFNFWFLVQNVVSSPVASVVGKAIFGAVGVVSGIAVCSVVDRERL